MNQHTKYAYPAHQGHANPAYEPGYPQTTPASSNFSSLGTMQVGAMELVVPSSGSTVHDPPNGGCRAWMIVLACFIINICNSVITMFVALDTGFSDDMGKTSDDILMAFVGVRKLGAVVAAILMVLFGYRIVGIIGCILYGGGLFITSWLDEDQAGLAGFLVGGVAGLGSSFLLLTAIVPPLEYFSTKRIRAIAIVLAGEVLGVIAITLVLLSPQWNDDIELDDFKWKQLFRYQLIPAGVALICCATLKPLSLTMDDGSRFVSRTLGVINWDLFKDIILYIVLLIVFLDQFGKPFVSDKFSKLVAESDVDDLEEEKIFETLFAAFTPFVGELVGLLLMVLCCCWSNRTLVSVLAVIFVLNMVAGITSCVAPSVESFWVIVGYGAILGFSKGIFNSLLENAIPDAFGRTHTRIVEGLFGVMTGVGELIVDPVDEKIDEDFDKDPWKVVFYVGGATIIASALLATPIIFRCLKPRKYN